jgi:hypothetical protein
MYVDRADTTVNHKTYTRYLLRTSYREQGKVKHRTLCTLPSRTPEDLKAIQAIRWALRHKDRLDDSALEALRVQYVQGPSVGSLWALWQTARRLGVEEALGRSRPGRLALWQVLARLLEPGSRLGATRLGGERRACDVLGLEEGFCEDDLYANLGWLAEHQAIIEDRLLVHRRGACTPTLFLYDVTSSYLEGTENKLGDWGYNRDRKQGKKQLVIGLLCDEQGEPVSTQVFRGNTSDVNTFAPQVKKVAARFGCERVTFVGDRGMIKSAQVEDLERAGFHYITAITKPQIESLLARGVFQMELFDEQVCEVQSEGVRYVLRRNGYRAEALAASRADKQALVLAFVEERNRYLAGHPRAKVETALRLVREKITRLQLDGWIRVEAEGRRVVCRVDNEALARQALLDGCYVLKTDVPREAADALSVHARYKDLTMVEQAFRTQKTGHLEIRPVHVRTADHTRGHVFVVMLAYLIRRELARAWSKLDLTVEEGIRRLDHLCALEMQRDGQTMCQVIPKPGPEQTALLDALGVQLPEALPRRKAVVATRHKLPARRKDN